MGWGFKSSSELFKSTADAWMTRDPSVPGGFRPRTIEDDHAVAAQLALSEHIPEALRDYFDATRMLWVYGAVYYPFFSMAAVHAGLCIELALKERYRAEGIEAESNPPTLAHRLRHAVNAGWLSPDEFTAIRSRRHEHKFLVEAMRNSGLQEEIEEPDESPAGRSAALAALIENARELRNLHAHPDFLMLLMPNWALGHLVFTRELIEGLFHKPVAPST